MQSLRLDSDIELSAPLELNGADAEPLIELLGIDEFAFEWGEISLSAIGDLMPDTSGVVHGSITISARNWQKALDLAVAAGAVRKIVGSSSSGLWVIWMNRPIFRTR